MDEPGPPPTLIQQACKPGPIPPSGGEVGETDRLRAALTWSYEFDLYVYDVWSTFACSVLFETPESSGPVPRTGFEVTEDSLGIERTVLLGRTLGEVSMEDVEIIPLDSASKQELAFKLLESSPEQRCIRYPADRDSSSYRLWRIRVGGLNALRNPSALAEARAGGWEPTRFHGPVTAFIEVADEFRIDRLSPSDAGRQAPQEQLFKLFSLISEGIAPDSVTLRVGCVYTYPLEVTGMEVTTPVFQSSSDLQDSRGLAGSMADTMKSWHSSVRPPVGEFVISLRIDGRDEDGMPPLVNFTRLLMSAESVVEV